MSQPILQVNKLTKRFRGLLAVNDLTFHVNKGEILGVIGPNGAGKSTTFNLITGVYIPDTGQVQLNGRNITGLSPNEICKKKAQPHLSGDTPIRGNECAAERDGRRLFFEHFEHPCRRAGSDGNGGFCRPGQ